MVWTQRKWFFTCCLMLLFFVGCGRGVEEGFLSQNGQSLPDSGDEDTGGDGDTDTDTDTDTDADADDDGVVFSDIECPGNVFNLCENEETPPPSIIEASYFDGGVGFVGITASLILAERTVEDIVEPLIVKIDFEEFDAETDVVGLAGLAVPPQSSLVPLGAVSRLGDPFSHKVMVLLKGRSQSALFGADMAIGSQVELVSVENGEPPANQELRGLIYLQDNKTGDNDLKYEKVCAFGDGIFCFDGTSWSTEVEPGKGGYFSELAMLQIDEAWVIVAVGDQGRITIVTQDGWQDLASGTESDLLTVSAGTVLFMAAGRDGVVIYGTADQTLACTVIDETIVSLNKNPDEVFKGITDSGRILRGWIGKGAGQICFTGPIIDGGLDSVFSFCGREENFLILKRTGIYGKQNCANAVIM